MQLAFANLTSQSDINKINDFMKGSEPQKYIDQFSFSLNQALDTIRASVGWLNRATNDVKNWLDHNVPTAG